MNLVAKEYVAAQDPDDPGVLVLSRFAGAAAELHEALIVNPYDIAEVAEVLQRALQMPLAERKRRWRALNETISEGNARNWCKSFLNALDAAIARRAAEAETEPDPDPDIGDVPHMAPAEPAADTKSARSSRIRALN